jgi:predicted dehydrogenase
LQVEPGSDVIKKYGIQAYDDLERALAQHPQAVFICNPSSLHIPVAIQAAQAGCHLFIEKPLSHNLDGIDALSALVAQNHLVTYVAYQMRFHPCLKAAYTWLKAGRIGPVLAGRAVVGEYLPGWHTYEDYRHMYASRRELGGGVILSQIHEMDMLYWFFGLPHSVYTLGGHLSGLEINVEDVASTLMGFPMDGRIIPFSLHQDYLQRPPSRNMELVGDRGKILVDLAGLNARCYDQAGQLVEEAHFEGFQRNQLFLDEISHFMACLRGEAQSQVNLCDGTQSLRMALAARESLESGRVIELQ